MRNVKHPLESTEGQRLLHVVRLSPSLSGRMVVKQSDKSTKLEIFLSHGRQTCHADVDDTRHLTHNSWRGEPPTSHTIRDGTVLAHAT